ncbi:MAG: hypothetical protein CVT62_05620 [Actinobacteria bacterium HGW-Actinobacteria-2]|nr:MAG: hypothetical protein CVT62_05620 [Actinobacteria bacterium HGW-Actinobacteria-2]
MSTSAALMIGVAVSALVALATIVVGGLRAHRLQRGVGWYVASGAVLAVTFAITVAVVASGLRQGFLGASGPQEVACEQVATFVDAPGLPSGLSEAHCTRTGFQDSHDVMPGTVTPADASLWLAQLPGNPILTSQGCTAGETTCIPQVRFDPRAKGGADFADFQAHLRSDGRLEFTFTALNT